MARYIDIEKAEYPYMSMSMWGVNSKDCKAYNEGVKATEDMITALPTADVVEVKHGEWINQSPYYALDGRYLKAQECSICHSIFVSDGNAPYSNHPYCCECGAKMDGERRDT